MWYTKAKTYRLCWKYKFTSGTTTSSGADMYYTFEMIDNAVRKILQAKMDSVEDLPADAPF